MRKLSILHTALYYFPHIGGVESVVQRISEQLVDKGHSVTVATRKLGERSFTSLNGVEVREFVDYNQYQEFVKILSPDVMMNYAAQQPFTDKMLPLISQLRKNQVNIICPCGYSGLGKPEWEHYFNKIIPEYIPQYDAAVYHSAQYQDYKYAVKHHFTNSVVIPNGAGEDEFLCRSKMDFRQKYGIKTKYMGLCVANFYASKGHDVLINCVKQMRRPDFTMVFIGLSGKSLRGVKAEAEQNGIKVLVGIPREEVVAAYFAADVFLFGSRIECSPLVILEAKASYTPFVSTDVGNIREWKGGIVCPSNLIHTKVNEILNNDELRKSLAKSGRKEWEEKFTWEKIVVKYEKLYLDLLNRR